VQLISLIQCSTCGVTEEIYIPLTQNIVINEEIIRRLCIADHPNWGYIEETDEWTCHHCDHAELTFSVSDTLIANKTGFADNVSINNALLQKLVKERVRRELGVDSDSIKANEVRVETFVNPGSDFIEFRISPVGVSWSDMKKRHLVKESEIQVP
jgi:ubiquitin C-terminal hydrolase